MANTKNIIGFLRIQHNMKATDSQISRGSDFFNKNFR